MKAVRLCTLMMLAVLATSLFAMPAEAQTSYPVECGQQVARVSRLQVEVEDTYKSFSANSFFIQKYDTTYKTLSFVNGYTFTGQRQSLITPGAITEYLDTSRFTSASTTHTEPKGHPG